MAHPEQGRLIVDQALSYLGSRISVERETKFEGRNLTTIIGKSKIIESGEDQSQISKT